jgi:hypothetical protein
VSEKINRTLQQKVRVQSGKDKNPTVAILDTQSAKTTKKGGSLWL